MARITIDDCLERIPDRFALTLIATKRARQLSRGAESTLSWEDHKSTVLALREIAAGLVTRSVLTELDLPAARPPTLEFEPLEP